MSSVEYTILQVNMLRTEAHALRRQWITWLGVGSAGGIVALLSFAASLLDNSIGKMPIQEIEPIDVLAAVRKIEAQGKLESARRTMQLAGSVFRYAVATARLRSDPTRDLRGALINPTVTHYGAITDANQVGPLLRAIDGYKSQGMTDWALKLAPHVFVRPGELRTAQWEEFDLEARVSRYSHRFAVDGAQALSPSRRRLSQYSREMPAKVFSTLTWARSLLRFFSYDGSVPFVIMLRASSRWRRASRRETRGYGPKLSFFSSPSNRYFIFQCLLPFGMM